MGTHAEHPELRELDHRRGDGFDVTLLWSARSGKVYVAVEDARTNEAFRIAVDPSRAMDAFNHPYAYGCGNGSPATHSADAPALPNGAEPR
jgi:hypothetical protein